MIQVQSTSTIKNNFVTDYFRYISSKQNLYFLAVNAVLVLPCFQTKQIFCLDVHQFMTQRVFKPNSLEQNMKTDNGNDNIQQIPYKPNEVEGQCILKEIRCLQFVLWKFCLFVSLCVITAGIPLLICYWYPSLVRWFYYNFCDVSQSTHFYIINYDDVVTIVQKQSGIIYTSNSKYQQSMFFINRYLKYFYDHQNNWFTPATYDYVPRLHQLVNASKMIGYPQEQVVSLRSCYGEGAMVIPTPSCPLLFVREVLQPFFIFIVYSVILWYYEEYYYYASVIALTSIVSIGINLWQVMDLNKKIFQMAYYEVKVHVLRNNGVIEISSVDVVPGDVVFIKQAIKLPFDCILLGGSVLMNECALTGESVPIVKKGVDKQEFNTQRVIDKNSYLFEGTELVQVCSQSHVASHSPYSQYGLMVCVTRTNFVTIKGQLIRIITFPKDREMKFYIESAKFVAFLFCLSIISYCILLIKLVGKIVGDQIALKFFDLITITVPPGLPASMTVGIAYSIRRLKQCNIFCISPDKIITGGRISHICFDKTGTLTELFMDFYEFIPKIGKKFQQSINLQTRDQPSNVSIMSKDESLQAVINMASCHSIMNLKETGELIGDPMEIKLFEFGRFKLTNQSSVMRNHPSNLFSFKGQSMEGTIFRRFEFNSDIHRMSVIASSTIDPNNAYVYCKGSPQALIKIMNPEGIPDDYFQMLKKYTSCGFRVLAVCSKKISTKDIQTIDRQTAESKLNFDGFEVFQNKLKPETIPAIQVLKQAGITIVIITGDNVLTGANIGFKSGIIDSDKNILICDLTPQRKVTVTNFYESEDVKKPLADHYDGTHQMIEMRAKKQKTQIDFQCEIDELPYKAVQIGKKNQYVFCITGSLFQEIYNTENNNEIIEIKRQFMNYIKVFARSKPNDKTKAISIFQSIGRITAMCGDGANDCGALKQADAGLSLAEAEASISAPFTSKVQNISSMVSLIRQCRGGLATNFSLFNIMALYSLIQYSSTVIVQYFYTYPSDFQYLWWDIGCNFFFFLTIGYTASEEKLSKLIPSDSLFSLGNVLSVLIMFALQLACQILTIFIMSNPPFSDMIKYWQVGGEQVNYRLYLQNDQQLSKQAAEPTAIFMTSNFMYLFSVLAFSISYPWKKPFYTNWMFMVVYIIIFIYTVLICMLPQARIPLFQMLEFEYSYKFNAMMLGLALCFGIFMYLQQKLMLEPLFRYLKNKHPQKKWL